MRNWMIVVAGGAMLAACSGESAPEREVATPSTDVEQAVVDATPAADPRAEDIRRFLQQEYADAETIRYATGWSDLDGDGNEEALIYLASPYFCGSGGCPTRVLTQAGAMWRSVGDISVSRTPVTVLGSETNGWKDLTVDVGGGGMPGGIALLKFDGRSYPSNPTVAPAESAEGHGTVIIPEDAEMVVAETQQASGG